MKKTKTVAKKAGKKACECIDKVNVLLKKQGDELVLPITSNDYTFVNTVRMGTSKRGSTLLCATFCPFCGKKYVK